MSIAQGGLNINNNNDDSDDNAMCENVPAKKSAKIANSKTTGLSVDDYSSPEEKDSSEADDDDDNDLNYSDQSDYDNYSAVDSDVDLNTSFQKNKSPSLNRIQGGPSKPDVSNMSESDAMEAMNKCKVERKKITDRIRHDRIKLAQSAVNIYFYAATCTGDNNDRLGHCC